MQCAAMSAPQLRSAPRARATIGFVPIESIEAARKLRSSSGYSPAKAPNPVAPVDSTAPRSRSTTPSAAASDTPAPAYVLRLTRRVYDPFRLPEELAVELRPARRAAIDEVDERV